PHAGIGGKNKSDGEEERRLFYVAVTRAEHKLFLSYANIRTIFGMRQVNSPSEFLSDIPTHLTALEEANYESNDKVVYL
ncbi:3'-5' exonuclease, partial [Streptomyces caeruleatus]